MNKRETLKAVKMAEAVGLPFPLDAIDELMAQYDDMKDALQEKIDNIEAMDNVGDATAERLNTYNERMQALENAYTALEELKDHYDDFTSAISELEATIS